MANSVAVSAAPEVPDKRVGAPSAGLAVLRYLNQTGTRAGVSRIARDVQLNPSTCFNLLRTLVYEDLVTFDPQTKTYGLGLGLIELAKGALDQASHARFMRPHLEAIAARHHVTATLWQRAGSDRVVLIDRAESDTAMRVHMQIGQRLPMYVAALGRCMAAHSGLGKPALRQAFKFLRWESPPTFEHYWKSVQAARASGFTTVWGVVLDRDGLPFMALSAVGFEAQLTATKVAALGADLRERAASVSGTLSGGRLQEGA